MTFEVILDFIKYLRLHNVSIDRNWFINECARKQKAKIPESLNHRVPEFFSEIKKNLRS